MCFCRLETLRVSMTSSLVDVAWNTMTTRSWVVVLPVRTWLEPVDLTGISPCSGQTLALTSATRPSVWSTPVCRPCRCLHEAAPRIRLAPLLKRLEKVFAQKLSRSAHFKAVIILSSKNIASVPQSGSVAEQPVGILVGDLYHVVFWLIAPFPVQTPFTEVFVINALLSPVVIDTCCQQSKPYQFLGNIIGTGWRQVMLIQSGPQKTVPCVILFKMLLHLFIRTKWHTILIASLFCTYWCQNLMSMSKCY